VSDADVSGLCLLHTEQIARIEKKLDSHEEKLQVLIALQVKVEGMHDKIDELKKDMRDSMKRSLIWFALIVVAAQILDERVVPFVLGAFKP
jgi:peptidoglycan hydrolase CwlO-like protein